MPRARTLLLLLSCVLAGASHASAQTSGSYKIDEHALNAGGHPEQGLVMSSGHYKVSLDSLGDGGWETAVQSVSFRLAGGMVPANPPPGEVQGVEFTGPAQMIWDPEWSAGTYNVYRAATTTLPGTYGSCLRNGLGGTTLADGTLPPLGTAFFYLVTAENSLWEEGTKGYRSNGAERPNPEPCP